MPVGENHSYSFICPNDSAILPLLFSLPSLPNNASSNLVHSDLSFQTSKKLVQSSSETELSLKFLFLCIFSFTESHSNIFPRTGSFSIADWNLLILAFLSSSLNPLNPWKNLVKRYWYLPPTDCKEFFLSFLGFS